MKYYTAYLMILILSCMTFVGCTSEIRKPDTSVDEIIASQAEPTDIPTYPTEKTTEAVRTSYFSTVQDVGLYEVEGLEQTYAFDYNGATYQAIYTPDNWKIIDSFKITNVTDIEIICQALSEVHKIHSADMESYRTVRDMAYEWVQHNLAYQLLPSDSPLKQSAKDVDINPADQGKNVYDFYKDRIDAGS